MLVVVVDPHMRTNSRSEKVAPGPAAGAASAVGVEAAVGAEAAVGIGPKRLWGPKRPWGPERTHALLDEGHGYGL